MTASNIPSTYVPARNTIFLSFALSAAEALKAGAIFIGANAIDFSGYPDCRPEFYKAFKEVGRTGTKSGARGKDISIKTPLLNMTKTDIVKLGMKLKVPYELTWSCYEGAARPCGRCDSCLLRQKGFYQAGFEDPLWKK
jgi:7-cyano-7-deazaguanine synthase